MVQKTKFVEFMIESFEDFLQERKNDVPTLSNLVWIYEHMSELPLSVTKFMLTPKISRIASDILIKFEK